METIKEAKLKQQRMQIDNTENEESNNFRLKTKHNMLLNIKEEKGITLVALVITTIVLLILARSSSKAINR